MPATGTAVDDSNIHNLRDILSMYNKITESCFARCATNLNQRHLSDEEIQCVDNCGGKYVKGNHNIMSTFMEIQGRKQQQMIEEMTSQQQQQQQQNIDKLFSVNQPAPEKTWSLKNLESQSMESPDVPST